MSKIKRALISVSDKTHLTSFCQFLKNIDVDIISTGGTAKFLSENGIPITKISEITGFPEIMDGRVKTLHPKVHGAILGIRDNEEHVSTMQEHEIVPIDLVVVNLYPFEKVSSNPESSFEEVIENIDIGGPSMVRSAAKNYQYVGVVSHPSQYNTVMKELKDNDGELSIELKKELSQAAFTLTSRYDNLISTFLKYGKRTQGEFDFKETITGEKVSDLRYGENPHQKAAFYKFNNGIIEPSLHNAIKLQGKDLSFNNILDFDGALSCLKEFNNTTCVIVKHTNPCGVANGSDCLNAFERAWACDSISAFGSVIAFNIEVDEQTASAITQYFVEGVIAPEITPEAKEIFQAKKNLRVMILPALSQWCEKEKNDSAYDTLDIKKITGGFLLQTRDIKIEDINDFEVVTQKSPSNEEMSDLLFSWKVVKHVKSNAIVYVNNKTTIGIGAGQMSRIDSANIGVQKAVNGCKGAVMASDAFFPFRDSVDSAAKAGISAIIQPGGSIRDQEVIDACNEHDIAMVFTNVRHFKH